MDIAVTVDEKDAGLATVPDPGPGRRDEDVALDPARLAAEEGSWRHDDARL